jgi:hypothetical protein
MRHTVAELEESPASSAPVRSDLRAHDRLSISGRLVLVWKDGIRIRSVQAIAKNVSQGGALVLSYRGLPVGSIVRLRSSKLFFLSGCAKVQHCARSGFVYQIGLKFYKDLGARF